jgi:hypothetical protein
MDEDSNYWVKKILEILNQNDGAILPQLDSQNEINNQS